MAPLGGTSPLFLKSVSQRSNNTFYRAKSRASFYREKPLAFRDHNKGFRYLLSQTLWTQTSWSKPSTLINNCGGFDPNNGPTPFFKEAVLLNGV